MTVRCQLCDEEWAAWRVQEVCVNVGSLRHYYERGVVPFPRMTWSLGAACRNEWRRVTGTAPERALRPKASGHGSNIVAVYPAWWRARGRELADALVADACSQMQLPFGGGE
jgi:hypothetical protein